ncbi:MAG: diaminopimelate epimerase, partial [Propionibacterium sp.]|nr:diaminopimelate epimerase [Propionibacterium sp.]
MTTTFWKAHGTGNDFVIVDRPDPLTPGQVRWLCHRRFGIGGDG